MIEGPALAAHGLARRFGHTLAVADIDLEVGRGETVAVFGPNGAGKTTLLKLLCGLLRPSAGEISLLGHSTRKEPAAARRRLGYIAHSSFLYRGLSARENLAFYASLYGLDRPGARLSAMLDRVGLNTRADDPVRTFSRGMLQRLSIARAFLHEPELLFLDEPYTGLDREASGILDGLLAAMRGGMGTVLMVTHDLPRGLSLATRVVLMSRGRIVDDRPAEGIGAPDLEEMYSSKVRAWVS